MADYLHLVNEKKKSFKQLYNNLIDEALSSSTHENQSAIALQRLFRGAVCRAIISQKNFACTTIQRCLRGHFGRLRSSTNLNNRLQTKQLSIFNYFCIQIQKCFRGYYSRKYKRDHSQRKKYVRMLEEQGAKIREKMKQYAEELESQEAIEKQEQRLNDFRKLASNLHHLISTKHMSGVYNPKLQFVEPPMMNGKPVEDHIRGVVKDLLRTRGIAKTGLIIDNNGTKKIPLKGLKYRLSIQASKPYDTLDREKSRELTIHKIKVANKGDFFAGGKTGIINRNTAPLCVGDPYMDPWANPMLFRGVPSDQKQLLESTYTRKPLFLTKSDKPFVSRVGGNRSTALPNDVFDVIAEAEETGGAVQRYRGTNTTRFGLPASADNRFDGSIPAPPVRTSSVIKTTRLRVAPVYSKTSMKTKPKEKTITIKTFGTEDDSTSLDEASDDIFEISLASFEHHDDAVSSDDDL
eukprot:gene13571-18212_t